MHLRSRRPALWISLLLAMPPLASATAQPQGIDMADMSIEDLYDPDTMPVDLRAAHVALDQAVDKIFRSRPFTSDEDRLELLLALYEKTLETANA